jgi:lipoate-protein ligase A
MSKSWRVVDTGLRPAAQNIALDRALLEARQAEEIPSTLRFLRFTPSALLGGGQSAEQEFNVDFCRAGNIAIQRRITGGNAIYTDEMQLDWQLYLHRRDTGTADMRAVARRICHAAATAISALGVAAQFRPRDDIVVDGRTISSGGGVFDGNALLYQGTLLIDFDAAKTLSVLRIATANAPHEAIEPARTGIAGLNGLLDKRADPAHIKRYMMEAFESEFDVEFQEGDLTLTENARYLAARAEIDTPDWVNLVNNPASDMPIYGAERKFAGGALRANVVYDRRRHRIKQVAFGGDVPVSLRRTILDLDASLRDTLVERIEEQVRMFFAGRDVDMQSLTADDFTAVLRLAVKQPIVAANRA